MPLLTEEEQGLPDCDLCKLFANDIPYFVQIGIG